MTLNVGEVIVGFLILYVSYLPSSHSCVQLCALDSIHFSTIVTGFFSCNVTHTQYFRDLDSTA